MTRRYLHRVRFTRELYAKVMKCETVGTIVHPISFYNLMINWIFYALYKKNMT